MEFLIFEWYLPVVFFLWPSISHLHIRESVDGERWCRHKKRRSVFIENSVKHGYQQDDLFFFKGQGTWKFPKLGSVLELQPWAYTTAAEMPDPSHICDLTYATAFNNIRSLTHWVRLGFKPTSSWILVGFLTHWATVGTLFFLINYEKYFLPLYHKPLWSTDILNLCAVLSICYYHDRCGN